MTSNTNSSLSTYRDCPRKYQLSYELGLTPERDDEKLAVGTCWHHAWDEHAAGRNAFDAITRTEPSPLWGEKLRRMFAGYQWYWQTRQLNVIRSEEIFGKRLDSGDMLRGKTDGVVRLDDGRLALLERKTTSEDIGEESPYWQRLKLDTQIGIYRLALNDQVDTALYDVVRKPTIKPKRITKADIRRIVTEIELSGSFTYCGEPFEPGEVDFRPAPVMESVRMYGARLNQDIAEQPEKYFARREVPRLQDDMRALEQDIEQWLGMIRRTRSHGVWPRNPSSCVKYGTCQFFGICQQNRVPAEGEIVPGFVLREQRHPELDT